VVFQNIREFGGCSGQTGNLTRCVHLKYVPRKKMVLLRQQNWGQQIFFFVAAIKNFDAATKRFVDRTKHFDVVT